VLEPVFPPALGTTLPDRRAIHGNVRKASDDGLVTVTGPDGRSYRVSPEVLRSAEAQARNTGPVKAGGTTGLGKPRQTGPAAASPADGPQRAMPGDLADRAVIKSLGRQHPAMASAVDHLMTRWATLTAHRQRQA
jgi:hypothetical protein